MQYRIHKAFNGHLMEVLRASIREMQICSVWLDGPPCGAWAWNEEDATSCLELCKVLLETGSSRTLRLFWGPVIIHALEEQAFVENCFEERGLECVRWLYEQEMLFDPVVGDAFWFIAFRLWGDRFADYVEPVVDEPAPIVYDHVWSPWNGINHFADDECCPRGHPLLLFTVGIEGLCQSLTGILQPGEDVLACGKCDYVRVPPEADPPTPEQPGRSSSSSAWQ
jgi:hypothetical protein